MNSDIYAASELIETEHSLSKSHLHLQSENQLQHLNHINMPAQMKV